MGPDESQGTAERPDECPHDGDAGVPRVFLVSPVTRLGLSCDSPWSPWSLAFVFLVTRLGLPCDAPLASSRLPCHSPGPSAVPLNARGPPLTRHHPPLTPGPRRARVAPPTPSIPSRSPSTHEAPSRSLHCASTAPQRAPGGSRGSLSTQTREPSPLKQSPSPSRSFHCA